MEVVRAAIAGVERGRHGCVRELHHPNAIVNPPKDWPEPGPFMGRDAAMRQLKQLRGT